MRKILYLIAILATVLATISCKKEKKATKTPAIVGEWQITDIITKSAEFAGQTVNIYLSFAKDKSFEMYQMIGQGRYRKFSGSWKLSGKNLSGSYSSGKAWGSSYIVSVSEDLLTLTATEGGEVDTYEKTVIPKEIKEESYE